MQDMPLRRYSAAGCAARWNQVSLSLLLAEEHPLQRSSLRLLVSRAGHGRPRRWTAASSFPTTVPHSAFGEDGEGKSPVTDWAWSHQRPV
eukprot:7227624-Prymnesium_polylepis.1